MKNEELFKKIQNLCKKNRITIKELEENIEIANGTIGKWGKNKTTPKMNTIEKIANYFNITVDYLITDNIDIKENEIIGFYRKANINGKEVIYNTAKTIAEQEDKKNLKPFA